MRLRNSAAQTNLPTENLLLASLPDADYQRLLPHLEVVSLPLGWVAYEAGQPRHYAYFPTEGIVSLLNETKDGHSTELAVTGSEGVVGISLFLGGGSALGRAVVRSAGQAYRLGGDVLKEEFERGGGNCSVCSFALLRRC